MTTSPPNGANPARHAAADAPPSTEPSIGELVAQVSAQLSTLVHSEIELAKLELRTSVKSGGFGVVLFAAAGVIFVFSLTFGLFALAEGLAAAGLDRWVAFLIVWGMLMVLVVGCVIVGIKLVKRVRAPKRTIETSKDTVAYLKANTKRG